MKERLKKNGIENDINNSVRLTELISRQDCDSAGILSVCSSCHINRMPCQSIICAFVCVCVLKHVEKLAIFCQFLFIFFELLSSFSRLCFSVLFGWKIQMSSEYPSMLLSCVVCERCSGWKRMWKKKCEKRVYGAVTYLYLSLCHSFMPLSDC